MKKQAFFRFWLIVCIIALTIPFASCDETVAPAETTAAITETAEILNGPETTIIPETTAVPETTIAVHTHSWSNWTITLNATCATEGKEERNCQCGEKETKFISALGHTEVIDKAVAATCTKDGKSEGKHCSVCKAVLVAQETVTATGHTYGDWVVTTSATCTINGREERVCACGKKEWQAITALGHTYGEWTVTQAATCTAKGKQERVCSCGKKETQSINKLDHTESEWIIEKEATCQAEGSQRTVCTVCNKIVRKTIEKLNREHTYEGGFCSICSEISPDFEFPSGYITEKPTEIETEFCILKIDENVYVVDGVAEKVDIVCRALEEVTGLKFKNDTYGKDKVVINVTHGEKPWGASGEDEEPFDGYTKDLTREITVGPKALFISDSRTLPHELAHALHFSQTKWHPSKIFIEGFATYVTHLTLKYLAEYHTDIQYALASTDVELQMWNGIDLDKLFEHEFEYWFDNRFIHMPHYHDGYEYYTLGFRMMWYIHDTYGDFTKWILYPESIDPSLNYYSTDKHGYRYTDISNENWFAEIKQIYGDSILDNFYPWLKANESLFEFDLLTKEAYDLTNIDYITMYPGFDYRDDFTETGKITYDNLYIDIEEAKKYLTEYKGKFIQYLRFGTLDGNVNITFYDKDGKVLYEATTFSGIWVGEEVSYIKLNGQGTVRNLEIIGYADYLENGLAFHEVYPAASTAYTELHCIYNFEGTHIIIPSEVNGLPVKSIKNIYKGTLDQVTEFTVSEGIEEMFTNTFRYLPNLKEISLPSTLNVISGSWLGAQTIEINYAGTKSDWNAIQKADNWDSRLNAYTIHCTDGDITKGN